MVQREILDVIEMTLESFVRRRKHSKSPRIERRVRHGIGSQEPVELQQKVAGFKIYTRKSCNTHNFVAEGIIDQRGIGTKNAHKGNSLIMHV